ncbi:envoplakin-like [Dunckerocampus dactyliophorus]|uniref:envoplakin-like n=1 Tax=Dunckerocampus dactyliophorus TaxID=161453 RepID=UPI00240499E9|nr:envoplakin-like [Dunckerocampus dactyliophorus]
MSKKQENSPVKISRTQATDLASLIARMQKNADRVEKNILQAEDLLTVDQQRDERNQPLMHQKENADNLAEAEGLLKDLFMDVDKAKRLQHPQASEIDRDVRNLHDRWVKDCSVYRDLYDQVQDLMPKQRIDWGSALDDKQRRLDTEGYGRSLSDVEKQIAAHNILHQEIEAYSSQLKPDTTSSQGQYAILKGKHDKLLESSRRRRKHLASLYEYMQSCGKELDYLSQQQDRILQRDWSDRMIDPPTVRMEYEKFKTNGLLSHEREVNQLLEEGDRLLDTKHPGSSAIQAHRDAVQNGWQSFLNLCLAQENHLDNVEDYKKFQLDAETLSESLDRLTYNLDPTFLAGKSNSEVLLDLQGDEPAVKRNEQRLAALRQLSRNIAPLKLRRSKLTKPTAVVALCDWQDEKGAVRRGDELTLKSIYDNAMWELQDSSKRTKTLPGACFKVPPPDDEAMQKVNSFEKKLADLKNKRSAIMTSLKTPSVEVDRPQNAVSVRSTPEDPKAAKLAGQLDELNSNLDLCKMDIHKRLRAPLDNRNPVLDLENRLQDHKKSAQTARRLESEKSALQRDLDPILAKKPLGPNASILPLKLAAANTKMDDINSLVDLYDKKASASMFLERQMQKVEGTVSGFEQQLVKDGAIPDQTNALMSRSRQLQDVRQAVSLKKDDLNTLGRDLDVTKQVCSSLQQNFNEYCPDIRRQESEVKHLKNRFTSVKNQLQERSTLIQEATNKNQDFQNAAQSLDFFLVNLPNNTIKPTDDVAQITSKHSSQKRVMEDIQRKSDDVRRFKDLSRELQNTLNEYEIKSNTYRGTLNDDDDEDDDDDDDEPILKKRQSSTMAQAVQRKEKDLLNRFAEVSAENEQLLNQIGTAKKIILRNEDKVSSVVVNQQLQLQSQMKDMEEAEIIKRDLNEEMSRRLAAENDLETYRQRYLSLKSRRGVERLEEKEVVEYYRDAKVEADLKSLKSRIKDEEYKRSRTHSEIDILNEKIIQLEKQLISVEPKLVTKVVTEYERDPQLQKEADKMQSEIQRIRLELQTRNSETIQVKNELTLLVQQKPKIREKVVKKEVVRLEKDPEMLKAVFTFKNDLAAEESHCLSLNNSIFSIRSQINTLERVIPTIEPMVVTKVVKQVQQDPESIEESNKLRMALEEEKDENVILMKDLTTLQLRYGEVEKLRPKYEVKEVINEIFRVDPETEVELLRLRNEMQDCGRKRTDLEHETDMVMTTLTTLRAQKPKIDYKEVTQEVIKEEKSPEVIRELQRLNNQVSRLQVNYNSTLELLMHLRKERDDLKVEKSKVQTKLVNKEVIKYENDPLLEKEVNRLRRTVREETQQRRSAEECVFDLQNQFIMLERQKPEEKLVVQEVVRLQKDPKQILEHERLNMSLDEEVKVRRKLEIEVRQLRALIQEKENTVAQMDERQKKIQIESELRHIKAQILELETTPKPVEEKIVIEEVLKVERDPKLEKLIDGTRVEMETEGNQIHRLHREISSMKMKLEILEKEKKTEKIVYREVVRVEKDPAVEAEREHLRDLVAQERNMRRDKEDNLQGFRIKINHLETSVSVITQEETTLVANKNNLLREKEDLLRQLKLLESQRQNISITFQQQSKLMSERTQMARQRSLKASSEIQRLEREILNEKDKHHQKEALILELKESIRKDDQAETHTRETNLSTKVTILDPDTGKDLAPYDAYVKGLIDRNQYIQLSELECDWEEITSMGPDGDTTVLQDRKSGMQYSVKDALKDGRLTQYDVMRYKDGKMPISEFALLVAGETRKPYVPPVTSPKSPVKSSPLSPISSMPTSMRSSYTSLNSHSGSVNNLIASLADEQFPISGIFDTTTESRMSVRSALTRKLIDADTALKLLEAQAASGGIVDLTKKDKLSVHKAAEHGLIDNAHMYKLLNAQKAFTGIEDPLTKERLSVGQAAQKGYIPQENAQWYIEAQYLTGGFVDPTKPGRLTLQEAKETNVIDSKTAEDLQSGSAYTKVLVDPISKEKISYKQAIDRCKKDVSTGLLLLPAASSDETDAPSYSNFRFNSANNKI